MEDFALEVTFNHKKIIIRRITQISIFQIFPNLTFVLYVIFTLPAMTSFCCNK